MSSSDASSVLSNEAEHYTGRDHSRDPAPVGKVKDFLEALTLKGATDRVLRKTVGNNTWIFVWCAPVPTHCDVCVLIRGSRSLGPSVIRMAMVRVLTH